MSIEQRERLNAVIATKLVQRAGACDDELRHARVQT
jgi:hypothetical protein